MRKIIVLATATVLVACGTQEKAAEKTVDVIDVIQEATYDKTLPVAQTTQVVQGDLSGLQTKESFMQAPFNSWFDSGYLEYTPDATTVAALKKAMKGITIRGYMGTWCSDSQRETPQFYKLMDAIAFKEKNITLVTVDESKKEPVDLVQGYNIMQVPTFIFYKDGKELGRYVEYARDTMEKDFLQIVAGTGYKHSYEN